MIWSLKNNKLEFWNTYFFQNKNQSQSSLIYKAVFYVFYIKHSHTELLWYCASFSFMSKPEDFQHGNITNGQIPVGFEFNRRFLTTDSKTTDFCHSTGIAPQNAQQNHLVAFSGWRGFRGKISRGLSRWGDAQNDRKNGAMYILPNEISP